MNNYNGCDENFIEKLSIVQNHTGNLNSNNLLKNYSLFQQIINPELRHNITVNIYFFSIKNI